MHVRGILKQKVSRVYRDKKQQPGKIGFNKGARTKISGGSSLGCFADDIVLLCSNPVLFSRIFLLVNVLNVSIH